MLGLSCDAKSTSGKVLFPIALHLSDPANDFPSFLCIQREVPASVTPRVGPSRNSFQSEGELSASTAFMDAIKPGDWVWQLCTEIRLGEMGNFVSRQSEGSHELAYT